MKRKKITALIIIFICCFSLHALSHKALISINVTSSFSKINEYVFENKTIESELNWKGFRPGIDVDFEYRINNFGFDLSVYSAIPIMSGSAIDKDYFISGSNMGKITKYSEHKLITDKDYRFTLDLWYYLFLNKIVLSFGLSGGYSNFKFESDDGFFQYPKDDTEPWTGNEEKIFLNGTAISYEQQRLYGGIGFIFSNNWNNTNKFNFNIKIIWYPFLKIDAIDNHFLRSAQFCDLLHDNASGLFTALSFSYELSKSFSLKFNTSYQFFKANGLTKTSPIGIITYSTSDADKSISIGTEIHELQIQIGGKIKL